MCKNIHVYGRQLSGDELVDAKMVASMTGLSVRTIRDLASQRKIPCYKVSSRAMRYKVSEIIDWIDQKKVA
jgi:predicted DNA-binding transcriptional regulator AlpA